MRIGICDTTFARFDMASAAIDELKNNVLMRHQQVLSMHNS